MSGFWSSLGRKGFVSLSDEDWSVAEWELIYEMTAHPGWKLYQELVQGRLEDLSYAIWDVRDYPQHQLQLGQKLALESVLGLREEADAIIKQIESNDEEDLGL